MLKYPRPGTTCRVTDWYPGSAFRPGALVRVLQLHPNGLLTVEGDIDNPRGEGKVRERGSMVISCVTADRTPDLFDGHVLGDVTTSLF